MTTANAMEMVKALMEEIDSMVEDHACIWNDSQLIDNARDMISEFYGENE